MRAVMPRTLGVHICCNGGAGDVDELDVVHVALGLAERIEHLALLFLNIRHSDEGVLVEV
jgi:hypothetical protein